MKKVRFGLIGCGLMAREFASAAARWCHLTEDVPQPEIVGICSVVPQEMEWFKKNFPEIKYAVSDYKELLEKEDLDLKVKLESLTKEKEIIFNNSSCHIMVKCSHCRYHGHFLHTCPIKRRKTYKVRQVWVPKGTRDIEINVNGSKAIWIPKSK